MASYELTAAADADLTEIYRYTFAELGEQQADAYFESLEEALTRLAENPQLGVDVCRLREGYRRLVHRRHSVYYRQVRSGVFVVRVLGPGMSPERNLDWAG